MKENDHAEDVKFMHNAFSVHNAFYVFMDRTQGKPNSQFLSSSGKKQEGQYEVSDIILFALSVQY